MSPVCSVTVRNKLEIEIKQAAVDPQIYKGESSRRMLEQNETLGLLRDDAHWRVDRVGPFGGP